MTLVNPSFESPVVPPGDFPALPYADGWIEEDNDTTNSLNTGVFLNPAVGQPGHLTGTDGNQAAFLGSQAGNGFYQLLSPTDVFTAGTAYRLQVALSKSLQFPAPDDALVELGLFIDPEDGPRSIVQSLNVAGSELSSFAFADWQVTTSLLTGSEPFVGQRIGVYIGALGPVGGFFNIDHVRLSSAVPEPASALLLALGALAWSRRRAARGSG